MGALKAVVEVVVPARMQGRASARRLVATGAMVVTEAHSMAVAGLDIGS